MNLRCPLSGREAIPKATTKLLGVPRQINEKKECKTYERKKEKKKKRKKSSLDKSSVFNHLLRYKIYKAMSHE